MIPHEKKVSGSIVYKGKIFDVVSDEIVREDGREAVREYVDFPEVVVVVPVEDDGRLLMIKQFRYPIDSVVYELPAGKVDKGEELEHAAKRELLEETGYAAKSLTYVQSFYPSCGMSNEKMHMFIAKDLQKKSTDFDEDEWIERFSIKVDKAVELIRKGEIVDLKTIAAILIFKYLHE